MNSAADLDLLPPTARDLAEAIGLDAALILVRRWQGARIWIPARPTQEWIELLGPEAAAALCRRYGLERIDVPRCVRLLRAARDRAIFAALESGQSANQAALAAGVTRRQIFNIKRAAGLSDPNPAADLFAG